MKFRGKLLLAALSAAAFLSIAVSSASATHIQILNFERGFRISWAPLEFEAAGTTVRCPVTLEGTFHQSTFAKVSGSLIGYVTRAIVQGGSAECANTGTARVLTESLPWHVRYASFGGTLPTITSIKLQLINASFAIDPSGIAPNCLARSTAANPAVGIATVGVEAGGLRQITTLAAEAGAEIPLTGGGGICSFGGAGHFIGSGPVTVLGGTATVKVRLI